MFMFRFRCVLVCLFVVCRYSFAQDLNKDKHRLVNVFLGSSGDHGQLSPAASSPFSSLSIGPQTNPTTHMGYEYLAKEFLGFTHNRFEGVGCKGGGGLILVKPFLGAQDSGDPLIKTGEEASPGSYGVTFTNGIEASFAVDRQTGVHSYHFPLGKKGIRIDLAHSINRAFIDESHNIVSDKLSGWIKARTICDVGAYQWFYEMSFTDKVKWVVLNDHEVVAFPDDDVSDIQLIIGVSSVGPTYAAKAMMAGKTTAISKEKAGHAWDELLNAIQVEGNEDRAGLFYSLFYRALQSPYQISEGDGAYRGVDGGIYHAKGKRYHGWAIWDNYKTQLPLLSLAYPSMYGDVVQSIAGLYAHGKKDFAGKNEPSNTVRTEHAGVVLLDAARKGYSIDFASIKDSLLAEAGRLDFTKPDRALESAYDIWALAGILKELKEDKLSQSYLSGVSGYRQVWEREFKDLTKGDVDRMSARGMYQGTIRQYRWAVPFDVKGLVELTGGKQALTDQLDDFFDHHYFNRANEPDMQSQMLYYASNKPWKYQYMVHHLAVDTVIQYYFNDNSRGIGASIDRIYKNEPKAYIRTMDDDAGAMSSWFVLTAMGLHPVCIGEPIYYLNVPLFPLVRLENEGNPFIIKVEDFGHERPYIRHVMLNGKPLNRLWLTHDEIRSGGELTIEAAAEPQNYGAGDIWTSGIKD